MVSLHSPHPLFFFFASKVGTQNYVRQTATKTVLYNTLESIEISKIIFGIIIQQHIVTSTPDTRHGDVRQFVGLLQNCYTGYCAPKPMPEHNYENTDRYIYSIYMHTESFGSYSALYK